MKKQNSKDVGTTTPYEPADDEALEALVVLARRVIGSGRVVDRNSPPVEPWMTPADAAAYAAVSEDKLRAWICSGQLPAGRNGKIIRVKRSDIDALLKGKKADASSSTEAVEQEEPAVDDSTSEAAQVILKSLSKTGRKRNG